MAKRHVAVKIASINQDARASWDSKSEEILITALQTAAAQGRKADNNFKPQVYSEISRKLATEGYALNAKQVKSRWNRFKSSWKTVDYLRNLSGFGWGDAKSCVTASDDVWNALLYVDVATKERSPKYSEYNYWRTHPFIYYTEIAELIGSNIATGDFAFSSTQAAAQAPPPDDGGADPESVSTPTDPDEREDSGNDAAEVMDDGVDASQPEDHGDEDEQPDQQDMTPSFKKAVAKRTAVTPPPSTPAPKRVRRSASDQINTLCSSVDKLVAGLISPSKHSPDRRRRLKDLAWNTVKSEEGLSPYSLAKARTVFRGGDELVEEYLSFDATDDAERTARSTWLVNEMGRLPLN
ncbi:hypothetical protein ONZ45_g13314 [Pleurotus djamor]|nr:hypothetical protein ONZ45_g13314 [Pleurotus djamor]